MKRVGSVVLAGLLLLGCRKDAAHTAPLAPWQWVVTGMKPAGVAAEPALLVCEADGRDCAAVKPGVRLTGSKLLRLERGVSEFELDSATRVEVAEGSELLLRDAPRTLELRSGGMVLSRQQDVGEAGSLRIVLVDRRLELQGRASLVAELSGLDRAQLFVSRGVVKLTEASGTRELHPGEGAELARQGATDWQALFAGKIRRFRQDVLSLAHPPPPPSVAAAPRGLGSMTARVPGSTAVVDGVRLTQHHVRALVRDGVAQTEVEEVFQNDTERVLEGRYVFPLPADASISGLTLYVNDAPVEAELVEKQRAAAIFKSIVEDTVRPRDPALLEWVQGSTFSLKVFPIPAKGSRKLLLRYQQTLSADGPSLSYVYPLSFGAERRTAIEELGVDVDVSDDGEAPRELVVSGYPATTTRGPRSSHVSLRLHGATPDHDFSLGFRRARPGAVLGTADHGFVAVRLRAELPPDLPPPAFQRKDRVLLLDASQSQSRESFDAARQLASAVLRALEPDERFAVLLCDSACEAYPKTGLATLAGPALGEAEAFMAARKPAGSSDLAGALRAGAERVPPGAVVQLVYVGDGAASAGELDASRIAARARPSFAAREVDLRLYGGGPSVDAVTLEALARELSGSYDAIASSRSLADRAEELVTGLSTPLLVAPELETPSSLSQLEPRTLPNLRLGEELVVLARYEGNLPFNVTLRGRLGAEPYRLLRTVPVQPAESALPLAARAWAEARIRELSTSGDPSATRETIELSKRFRVMSRETSWLVLENERMFAEFGVPPRPEQSAESAAERAQLANELDRLDGAVTTERGDSGSTETAPPLPVPAPEPAKRAPPAADKAAPTPPPAAAPAGPSSGGGLSGLGSSSGGVDSADRAVLGPRGNASVGGISASGGTVANASRVVAGMRAAFRACYQRGLLADPSVTGKVTLTLGVASDGTVASAQANVNGNLSASIVACVQARARSATFDAPQGGRATISVPITFTSDSGLPTVPLDPGPGRVFEPPRDRALLQAGDDRWTQGGDAALDKLRAELDASPTSRKRHEALVRGLLLRGRFAPALAAAERFVELDPDLALARQLLAYAAVATGDRARATSAFDDISESAPNDAVAQGRAARAFEALGDEARACAHWRALFELLPGSDAARYEALRCRARVLGDAEAALADARAADKPGPLLRKLLPLLEAGQPPRFEKSSGSAGQLEVTLSCDGGADCPYAIVLTPSGSVLSALTPGLGRSSATSFAFSGLLNGAYRVLLVGGAPNAKGRVELRALGAHGSFAFAPGTPRTLSTVQVKLAPSESALLRPF